MDDILRVPFPFLLTFSLIGGSDIVATKLVLGDVLVDLLAEI